MNLKPFASDIFKNYIEDENLINNLSINSKIDTIFYFSFFTFVVERIL